MESALRELEKAVRIQSDVVEDTRKLLARTAEHTPESQAHEVRLKFETQQRLLEAMNEKFAADIINSKFISLMDIHEEPRVPQLPSSPNVTLNLLMGACLGLLFGILLAVFVRFVVGGRPRSVG
jgi:polysaccharide biosynthesis transport protein